jgi:amino acid transporter
MGVFTLSGAFQISRAVYGLWLHNINSKWANWVYLVVVSAVALAFVRFENLQLEQRRYVVDPALRRKKKSPCTHAPFRGTQRRITQAVLTFTNHFFAYLAGFAFLIALTSPERTRSITMKALAIEGFGEEEGGGEAPAPEGEAHEESGSLSFLFLFAIASMAILILVRSISLGKQLKRDVAINLGKQLKRGVIKIPKAMKTLLRKASVLAIAFLFELGFDESIVEADLEFGATVLVTLAMCLALTPVAIFFDHHLEEAEEEYKELLKELAHGTHGAYVEMGGSGI